jgi:hypothetical protein
MRSSEYPSLLKAIAVGGAIAGVTDILDPIIFFHFRNGSAIVVLQAVASGLLGHAAFSGGVRTALLGLAIHFCIAFFWATVFVLAARVLPFLSEYPIRSGLLFGVIVYGVMNYLVLPLSRVAPSNPRMAVRINGILAILFLVGVPISLANYRFAPYSHK